MEDQCGIRCIHQEKVDKAKSLEPSEGVVESLSRLFGAVSDPTRLRLVMALSTGEMCVCDLAAALAKSESAVSHQLRRLRDRNLVKRRREGQILYYSLDDEHVSALLALGLAHVLEEKNNPAS